jgi:hypothetical protein
VVCTGGTTAPPAKSARIARRQYGFIRKAVPLILTCEAQKESKYPPAEPEALRLLAPQRGLIATGEKQKQQREARLEMGFGNMKATAGGYSRNSRSLTASPAEPGELPIGLVLICRLVL